MQAMSLGAVGSNRLMFVDEKRVMLSTKTMFSEIEHDITEKCQIATKLKLTERAFWKVQKPKRKQRHYVEPACNPNSVTTGRLAQSFGLWKTFKPYEARASSDIEA